ncbi:MAG TPA: hypothetical protein H9805_10005 [Candidatus Janibacter merdipullorum]|nr:hypothetical protein [Candidatus Janibacter merdipullorum]
MSTAARWTVRAAAASHSSALHPATTPRMSGPDASQMIGSTTSDAVPMPPMPMSRAHSAQRRRWSSCRMTTATTP